MIWSVCYDACMYRPVGALLRTAAAESAASSATAGGAALQAMLTRLDATLASRGASEMGGRTDRVDAAGAAASHLAGAELPGDSRISHKPGTIALGSALSREARKAVLISFCWPGMLGICLLAPHRRSWPGVMSGAAASEPSSALPTACSRDCSAAAASASCRLQAWDVASCMSLSMLLTSASSGRAP